MDITQDIKGVFDNGGMYNDRYTVVFNDRVNENLGTFLSLGLSEDPEDPEGVSIWTESSLPNSYLGKRIEFAELPDKLKKYVQKQYYGKTASLEGMTKMADVIWDHEDVLKELIEEFGEEAKEDLEASLDLEKGRYDSWGNCGSFTTGGIEYNLMENEEEAERIALELVKDDLDDQPEIFTQSWLESFIDEDAWMNDLEGDLRTWVEESPDSYDSFIDREEPAEEDGSYSEDQIDRMVEGYKDSILRQGLLDWMQHDLGYEGDALAKQMMPYIDINEAAQGAIDTDGWAHFLSLYDGDYRTTKNGLVYFRE